MLVLNIVVAFLIVLSALSLPATAGDEPPPTATDKLLSPEEYYDLARRVEFEKRTLNVDEFFKLKEKGDIVILDLRSQPAYEAGHIEGALPFGADITQEKLIEAVPDKTKTIVIYCSRSLTPTRSPVALTTVSLPQFLVMGYKNTYQLESIIGYKSGKPQTTLLPCVKGSESSLSKQSRLVFDTMGYCVPKPWWQWR